MHHLTQEETDILTGIIKNMTEGEFLGKEEECEMFKRHLGEFCFIFSKGIELGKSQLQPPVISAMEVKDAYVDVLRLLELGYDNKAHVATVMEHIKAKIADFLQRQGQKTVSERHFFVRHNLDENDRFCDKCGLYFTDEIHFRADNDNTK